MKDSSLYYIDGKQLRALHGIMRRLYSEQRMAADEMRDLANKMFAIFAAIDLLGEVDA